MCGVAGAFGVRDAERAAAAMSAALAHRGPDDHGQCTVAGIGGRQIGALAHRRLSILDLTEAGRQPMHGGAERLSVAFNGEIYNFRTLRSELERDGARFASSGDTAVLLEAWARRGAAAVDALHGMFAFALWDGGEECLYLVRDSFGIKPLYYALVGTGIVFASEVRALLASGHVPPRVSAEALRGYLAYGSVPEPLTILDGVRAVPAGSVLQVTFGDAGARVREVHHLHPLEPTALEPARDRGAAVAGIRRALDRSVERHLVSDVPVAVFLSGGVDSSAVAALAARSAGRPLDSFTVTFAERAFDESAIARRVAAAIGTRHHEIPLGGHDLLSALPDAFAAMDQPSLDGLNTFVVSRAVRSAGVKVVLSGLGGDELFGGYPSFRRALLLARFRRLPAPLRTVGAEVAERLGGARGGKLALAFADAPPADAAYIASRALFGEQQISRLTGRRYRHALGAPPWTMDTLQQVSWRELTGYMRQTLLRDSDVFSMAHGLELRVPFVDREVAAAAFAAARWLDPSRAPTKALLVEATRDLLPREVWDRPKQGFVLPFAGWMRGALRQDVEQELAGDSLAALGVDPGGARLIWRSYLDGVAGVSWSRPWALYTLARWARVNGASAADRERTLEAAGVSS